MKNIMKVKYEVVLDIKESSVICNDPTKSACEWVKEICDKCITQNVKHLNGSAYGKANVVDGAEC